MEIQSLLVGTCKSLWWMMMMDTCPITVALRLSPVKPGYTTNNTISPQSEHAVPVTLPGPEDVVMVTEFVMVTASW